MYMNCLKTMSKCSDIIFKIRMFKIQLLNLKLNNNLVF